MDTFIYLFIFPPLDLIMFYSSHFHQAVEIFFPLLLLLLSLQTSFSHRGENYSCSGKREQMSAAAACAYRRIHPHAFSGNGRERSHSIPFNPSSGNGRAGCTSAPPKQLVARAQTRSEWGVGGGGGGWTKLAMVRHKRNHWKGHVKADPELI